MSKISNWMPLYIGDYLADTMHFTAEEHGAYLLLIMHYWRTAKPLPNDVNRLQKIARINPSRVSGETMQTIMDMFTVKGDKLYHKRIDEEMEKAREHEKKQRDRTSAATEAKKKKAKEKQNNENVTKNVTKNVTTTPLPLPLGKVDKSTLPKRTRGAGLKEEELPEWIDREAWREWKKMRIRIKAPVTKHAENLGIAELQKLSSQGYDPTECINSAILHSWKSFYAPKQQGNNHGKSSSTGRSGRTNEINAAFDELKRGV